MVLVPKGEEICDLANVYFVRLTLSVDSIRHN